MILRVDVKEIPSPKAFRAYLTEKRWIFVGIEKKAEIYHRVKNNHHIEVVVVTDPFLGDYEQRLRDAIQGISIFEQRDEYSVYKDIMSKERV